MPGKRTLAYEVRIKKRHAAKGGKVTKEERTWSRKEVDIERGISSKEKEVSSRGKT